MYSIRCTVKHDYLAQQMGLYESNYIILVDTSNLNTAFDVARRAMDDKYHGRYTKRNFTFSSGAQRVNGHLNDGVLFQVLLSN